MFNFIKGENLRKKAMILPLLGGMFLASGLSSCDDNIIYEHDDSCHSGINLQFIYDYHMEPGANSFPANVDCVTVYVFDTDENYLGKYFMETTDILKDENYRMHLPLDEGDYHLVVYGGTSCEHSAFNFEPDWQTRAEGKKSDIKVTLPLEADGTSHSQLHDIAERTGGLFYGTLDVTITEHDWQEVDKMRTEKVYLMKDTNNIQVILQELSYPRHVDYKDFDYKIIDDNFVLDGYNALIPTATENFEPYYKPYAAENRLMGFTEPGVNNGDPASVDPDDTVQVACAEFSTSRLFADHMDTARLVVTSNKEFEKDGSPKVVIDMPLIKYLMATKGFGQNWLKVDPVLTARHPGADNLNQQYLDRQSSWTLFFFLQKNVWVNARVVVNSWTVRENNINF